MNGPDEIYDRECIVYRRGEDQAVIVPEGVSSFAVCRPWNWERDPKRSEAPTLSDTQNITLDPLLQPSAARGGVAVTLGTLLIWACRRGPRRSPWESSPCIDCGHYAPFVFFDHQSALGSIGIDRRIVREVLQTFVETGATAQRLINITGVHAKYGAALRLESERAVCVVMGLKPETLLGDDPMPTEDPPEQHE